MDVKQFRELIVRPTLKEINLWSQPAENILIGTAVHESNGLQYIKQIKGPALSFYQIEPATAHEVWNKWLPKQKSHIKDVVYSEAALQVWQSLEDKLLSDLRFATILARLNYRRFPEELPVDVPGMARLWKLRWNTHLGAGTEEQFINNYQRFVK